MAPALSKYNSPPKKRVRRGKGILTQSQAIWKLVRDEFSSFFFFSIFRIQFVTDRFDPFRGPGWCWWSARREAHCLYANWTTWPLYAFGHIWRHRWLGEDSPSEVSGAAVSLLRLSLCYWLLCSVAMSCLDVMYHQSYGAHYLPAAAYKATYYNHHQQQQQVRCSSLVFGVGSFFFFFNWGESIYSRSRVSWTT